MADEQDNGGDDETPRPKKTLPDDAVERAKNAILYGVGYKRPPPHTRFKKGRSGNPKGRPRTFDLGLGSDRSANAIVLREGERLISVREGGEIRQMPTIDAMVRKQVATALGGSAYAQKSGIQRYDWAEREERERRLRSIEFWEEYIDKHQDEINQAKERKEEPPSPYPHPDDIVIDYDKGVQFKGPINEEELARLEEAIKIRDVLIMQDALDQREAGEPETDDPDDRPGTAIVYALMMNMGMPKRFKLSENEMLFRTMRYDAMPKRVLLKELHRTWREAGIPQRRGYTFPPLNVGIKTMDFWFTALGRVQEGDDLNVIAAKVQETWNEVCRK